MPGHVPPSLRMIWSGVENTPAFMDFTDIFDDPKADADFILASESDPGQSCFAAHNLRVTSPPHIGRRAKNVRKNKWMPRSKNPGRNYHHQTFLKGDLPHEITFIIRASADGGTLSC